jgi:protein-tyrosine sulfotransferase
MKAGQVRRAVQYLPVLVHGRPLHGLERYRPFFVVGSGRCGSTLLRAMLEVHPDVHIPPENDLRAATQDYRRYTRLPWSVLLRIVLARFEFHPAWDRWDLPLGGVYRELDRLPPEARHLAAVFDAVYRAHTRRHKPSASRWGDKTPLNVHLLSRLMAIFPDLRVVHMLRDGRDVVRSCLDVYGESFGMTLSDAAQMWRGAVRAAQAFGARCGHLMEVRYEDLVRDPRETLRTVVGFLDLSFEEQMLRHHEQDLQLGDVERIPHLQGVRQPIHTRSVGRWRREFSRGELAELGRLLGPTLAALGYDKKD